MSSADGETGGLPRKAFTAAFFAPLLHAQLHQRLVDAEMQVFGMAEPPHGQTAGLHSLHKRVLFFPMAAIDQSLRGQARCTGRIEFPLGVGLVRTPTDGCAVAQAIDADRDIALPDPLQADLGRGLIARGKINHVDNGMPGFAHCTLSLRDVRPVFGMLSQL